MSGWMTGCPSRTGSRRSARRSLRTAGRERDGGQVRGKPCGGVATGLLQLFRPKIDGAAEVRGVQPRALEVRLGQIRTTEEASVVEGGVGELRAGQDRPVEGGALQECSLEDRLGHQA